MEANLCTRVPAIQTALAPDIWVLMPLIQMSSLVETHHVKRHDLPALAAELGLGLLFPCSGYYYHAPFLMQSNTFLSLGCSALRPCPNLVTDFLLSHPRPQE